MAPQALTAAAQPAPLTAAAILQCDDLKREYVHVPEWGGGVFVHTLKGEERDAFDASCIERRGKQHVQNLRNVRARLLVRALRDEQGNRLFRDDQAADLGAKSSAAIDRLFDVAQRLNGLTREDIEDLAGN